jgi:S1-C subfamily serine protease
VVLSITNWENDQRMRIKSNSYIIDPSNSSNIYPILLFENNELDKVYSWGNKGKTNYLTLVFGRIPPGIQKIDVVINPKESDQYNWLGVVIKNPDNHPKTSWTEKSIKEEWDKNGFNPIEGIYENTVQSVETPKYKLALKKEGNGYNLIYLTGADFSTWKTGDIKAYLTETATPLLFKVKWYMGNKEPNENLYITFEQGSMKVIWTDKRESNPERFYLKLYPTASVGSISKGGKTSGTGFALTYNGLIITNNHVIEGVNSIVVRGINGNFDKTFTAKVLITDKNNDLAILKIEDPNFTNLGKIPYVMKTSVASVGENVFVMGYPLRATMGDEIKLTNGIISSKTGFQGDVTSYQISAPVQPGNSGGPLFDKNGDLIGIINAKHAGAENASYAVKTSYLKNLVELLDNQPTLQTVSIMTGKSLTQQVEIVKKYVYIIEGQ